MQITVLGCANAAGDFMPPYLVYLGQLMTVRMGYENFRDAIYTQMENGWMDTDCFFEFICYFDSFVTKLGIRRPVILWVDGHVSHIGAETARFCHVNNIILFVLLGNATFIIQPFDIGIFSKLKQAWVKAVRNYTKDDFSRLVTKGNFSHVFKMAWEEITGSAEKATRIATNAFKCAGIFPFDSKEVDFSRLVAQLEKETETIKECQPYTLSGFGIVDENETVVDPTDAPAAPTRPAEAPAAPTRPAEAPVNVPAAPTGPVNVPEPQPSTSTYDIGQIVFDKPQQSNGIGNVAASVVEPAQPDVKNLTEMRNNAILNDPDRVTEFDPNTGVEQILVQPQIALKTEDGQLVGTVPAVMIPVKRGAQYVSEAAKKLKQKEDEVTKMLAEKNRKHKQGSKNIRRYVTKAQSRNEALQYFNKKEEEKKRELQEKERCKEERIIKKEEKISKRKSGRKYKNNGKWNRQQRS